MLLMVAMETISSVVYPLVRSPCSCKLFLNHVPVSNPNGTHWVTNKRGIKIEGGLYGRRRGSTGVGGKQKGGGVNIMKIHYT